MIGNYFNLIIFKRNYELHLYNLIVLAANYHYPDVDYLRFTMISIFCLFNN